MSNFIDYNFKRNPDASFQDSTYPNDFIKVDNSSETKYGLLEKMKDKVYPIKNEITTKEDQNYYISKEINYKNPQKKTEKPKIVNYYETLCWYFEGNDIKDVCDVKLGLGQILKKYNAKSYIIRDIRPVTGKSTLDGIFAHVICVDYPLLNRCKFSSNREKFQKQYFANIAPGNNTFEKIEKIDILNDRRNVAFDQLLGYMDDNENYPFGNLVVSYNNLDKTTLVKLKRGYGKELPKDGMDYLKQIITVSKKIPFEEINKMGTNEFMNEKFKTPHNKRVSEMSIVNPTHSQFYQFASMCPFYEGRKRLKYFNILPKDPISETISLPRFKELLKILKLIKRSDGTSLTTTFRLNSPRNLKFIKQNCVSLKVCAKIHLGY